MWYLILINLTSSKMKRRMSNMIVDMISVICLSNKQTWINSIRRIRETITISNNKQCGIILIMVSIASPICNSNSNSCTCSRIHRYNMQEIIICSKINRISNRYIRISSKIATNKIFRILMYRITMLNNRMLNTLHNMEINSHNSRDLIGISNRCLARVKLINKLIRVNISLMNWRNTEGS